MRKLKLKDHGIYQRTRRGARRDKGLVVAAIETDRVKHPYYLVHGVPIDMSHDPVIHIVKDTKRYTHAEFVLINGTRVFTFNRRVVRLLWRLGANVRFRSYSTLETARRWTHVAEAGTFGDPKVYELPRP